MQGVALVGIFIKVTPFAADSGMGQEQVLGAVEKYIRKYFGKRGEHVVQENLMCVRRGLLDVMEIPRAIIEASADSRTANETVVLAK
jgi:pyocin large subunit-like protein